MHAWKRQRNQIANRRVCLRKSTAITNRLISCLPSSGSIEIAKNTTTITSGSDVADKIRKYVSEHFLADFGVELTDDSDLFAEGIIDSFGFVELVVFLETTFGVKF